MKTKINRRLIRIGILCFIIAIVLTASLYRNMKTVAQPEETIKIAHFSESMIRDTILQERDIQMLDVPASRAPMGAITSKEILVGKRLIIDVNKGEYAFINKVSERGDIRVDIEDMWLIGLDVKDISNFMGAQLKVGESYALLYPDEVGNMEVRHQVKIVALIDNLGKEIFREGEGVPKTINIALKTKEEMLIVSRTKNLGANIFEIVRAPQNFNITDEGLKVLPDEDNN